MPPRRPFVTPPPTGKARILGLVKSEPQEPLPERLIREAMERGDFDDLPGTGKPLPGRGTIDDQYWWVREWVKRDREAGSSGE